jgi:hypothetical protein
MSYCALPIIQPNGRTTIGIPYTIDDNDIARCPICNAQIDDDEYNPGYGFAYGGGLGTYTVCSSDECDWFYKELDLAEKAEAAS